MDVVIFLVVGAVAGWLAGIVIKGNGFGLIGDIIVGILGGVLAGWLSVHVLHIPMGNGILGQILSSAMGAILLLLAIRLARRG